MARDSGPARLMTLNCADDGCVGSGKKALGYGAKAMSSVCEKFSHEKFSHENLAVAELEQSVRNRVPGWCKP
jgi:hypothetical protein